RLLEKKGAMLSIYDPYVKSKNTVASFKDFLKKSNYIVLATNHTEFTLLKLQKLKDNNIKIIIDGRNCLDKEKIKSLGIIYKGIGR
ncbi:hypothetical protein HYX13_00625, partial [Candidatus Woesearchaeota archaeon]|nr:hypothetical protein [Candidatus Woesearchaeota archaeon]